MWQLLDHEASRNLLVAHHSAQHDALHKLISQLIELSNIDFHSRILRLQSENDALIVEVDSLKKEMGALLIEGTRVRENVKRLVRLNSSVSHFVRSPVAYRLDAWQLARMDVTGPEQEALKIERDTLMVERENFNRERDAFQVDRKRLIAVNQHASLLILF